MTHRQDDALVQRLGHEHYKKRSTLEKRGRQPAFTGPGILDSIENRIFSVRTLTATLKLFGLYRMGQNNARNIEIVEIEHRLSGLGPACSGKVLLQLSDLHIDVFPDFDQVILDKVAELDYDAVVLTGDYRFDTAGEVIPALDAMARLAAGLKGPMYAILGNHDSLNMIGGLEDAGFRVLLNESEVLWDNLHIAGIDDPHYFECHDFEKACQTIPSVAPSILLAHSPEVYLEAEQAGFDLLLCGHTHGGQIRLPGGIPLTLNADCPRRFGAGSWHYKSMLGYTSRGTGSSLLDVRFNCKPEATLHRIVGGP